METVMDKELLLMTQLTQHIELLKPRSDIHLAQLQHNGKRVTRETRKQLRERLDAGELHELEFTARFFNAVYPNANHYRFRDDDLPAYAASYTGQPFLRNHDEQHIESRDGTILSCELTQTTEGTPSFVANIELTTQRGILSFLEGQIDRFSSGWDYDKATCTVCNGNYFNYMECRHYPGRTYTVRNDQGQDVEVLCEIIWENPRGTEVSAVNNPAVAGTELLAQLHKVAQSKQAVAEYQLKLSKETSDMDPNEEPTTTNEPAQDPAPTLEADPAPAPAPDPGGSPPPPAAPSNAAAEWHDYIQKQATNTAIQQSGVPEPFHNLIRNQLDVLSDPRPQDVENAIATVKTALAATLQDHTVKNVNPIMASQMTTGMDVFENAIEWNWGLSDDTPPPDMRELRTLYFMSTGDYDKRGVFKESQARLANVNTGTFIGVTMNAVNKLVMTYMENSMEYRWFEKVVEVVPHNGTGHDIEMIFVDGIGELPIVKEGKPYTEALAGDSQEDMSFAKRGHYIGITLEMILKSDMRRIRQLTREMIQGAIRTRSAYIAALFTQNNGQGPAMDAQNGRPVFHAEHNNLMTAALTRSGWRTMRSLVYNQIKPGTGKPMAVYPNKLLIPETLEHRAHVILGYGGGRQQGAPEEGGTGAQEVDPYAIDRPGSPRAQICVVPEWQNTQSWAALTDPMMHASIEMAYMMAEGGGRHPRPEVYQANDERSGLMFTHDTLAIKIRDWWAAGWATPIGAGKSNV